MRNIIFICLLLVVTSAYELKTNKGKYSNYYHIKYTLKPNMYQINTEYGFTSGGQFEVYIPKKYFPISAPNCKKNIILRMPGIYSSSNKKETLYKELLNNQEKTVVIELNPYLKVKQKEPLILELKYCNVFFRHKNDDYYDKL